MRTAYLLAILRLQVLGTLVITARVRGLAMAILTCVTAGGARCATSFFCADHSFVYNLSTTNQLLTQLGQTDTIRSAYVTVIVYRAMVATIGAMGNMDSSNSSGEVNSSSGEVSSNGDSGMQVIQTGSKATQDTSSSHKALVTTGL